MAGEGQYYGLGAIVLDNQIHTYEGRQTVCRDGGNVTLHEGASSEQRCYRLLQFHGRIHIDPLLRDSEFSLGNSQQLFQRIRLDQAIYLQTVTHHTISIDFLEHVPTKQDQQVSPRQVSRRDNDRAGVSGRGGPRGCPSRKQIFVRDKFQQSILIPHQFAEILDPGSKRCTVSKEPPVRVRSSCQANQTQHQCKTPYQN